MKRSLIISLLIFITGIYLNAAEPQKKQPATQKDDPCIIDCNKEHKKCLDATRKVKKTERKEKIAQCNKALKECKANCEKPSEQAPAEKAK